MTDTPNQESDLDMVLSLADRISGNRQESLLWLRRQLQIFHGKSPENLVLRGRVDDLVAYFNSVSVGFVG
jgi:hypothetical protein